MTSSASQVRVLNVTHVHPDQSTNNQTPPPLADHAIKLSFLDTFHIATGAIQRLFFYEGPDLPPFPFVVRSLRSSLAAILPVFLPLAGKLTFRASTDDVVVDCSRPIAVPNGVKFVEAEFSGGADGMRRLAAGDEHDIEAFMKLVPDLEARQLPAPVLAVQVTRPASNDGEAASKAVAVGVSIHHAVADGKSVWQFMRWWSAASRDALLTAPDLVPPTFDRKAIQHPRAEELAATFLRLRAPTLPMIGSPSSSTPPPAQRRRTFQLSADKIQSLKQHISLQSKTADNGQPSKPPSTYVAICSLVWTCVVRAKSLSHADDAFFVLMADCRGRLRPPVDEGFFGNCISGCVASANVGHLLGDAGLARAASAVQSGILEQLEKTENPLMQLERRVELLAAAPPGTFFVMGSSHRFKAYETDFGWGAPSRVELVSVFGKEMVTLLGAREDGSVQVSAALDGACMDAFAAHLLCVAGGARPEQ